MVTADRANPGRVSEHAVASRERRKRAARRKPANAAWFGLGMFGLVGWSVAIPTVVGIAAGVAIDAGSPGRYSWTLMLMMFGVLIGCLNAWYWVNRQRREIERDRAAGQEGIP